MAAQPAGDDARAPGAPIPVAFLLNSLGIGGSERKTVRIANELQERGHDVHLVYLNPPDTLLADVREPVRVHQLGRRGKFSLRAAGKLGKILKSEGIRVLFCVNLHPLLYAFLGRGMSSLGDLPIVALVNKSEFLAGQEKRVTLFYRHFLRRAAKIVFGCRAQQEEWIRKFGLPSQRCTYVYNGVDLARFSLDAVREAAAVGSGPHPGGNGFTVGCVGQLRPEKKHSDLILAVERLRDEAPGVRLLIVGDGPERDNLERLVSARGLGDAVSFLGEMSDPRAALAAMSVFVLSSTAVETFSNAALEAMAMGRAVILSDIGGAREMVDDGRSGLIYPKGDVAALVQCLRRLRDEPSTRAELGHNARETAEREFSDGLMFTRYETLIREVLAA